MRGWMLLMLWTATAALIALVAGWQAVVGWSNANSGLASWVQAIGSIMAIGATAGVVLWQHDLERRRAREADSEAHRRKISVIVELARGAANHAALIQRDLSDRETIHDMATNPGMSEHRFFRSLGLQLEAIPLHELDDPYIAKEVLIISATCRQAREKIAEAVRLNREMDATAFIDFFAFLQATEEACSLAYRNLKAQLEAI